MTDQQKRAALNAAGDALRNLGLGCVRLRYAPATDLVPRDTFQVWLEVERGLCIGHGATPAEALDHAIKLAQRPLAKAA